MILDAGRIGSETERDPRMPLVSILVVEDDRLIRRGIVLALESAGYAPLEAVDGKEGLTAAIGMEIDLVLLDVLLPKMDGFKVLRQIRIAQPALPVIMLTARGAEEDRVRGLTEGADDYVLKPFSHTELLARIEAVLRRSPARPCAVTSICIAGREIDFERREVVLPDGTRIGLSEGEVALLQHLAANRGRVHSRDELLSSVWGIDPRGVQTRAVDKQVARLREALGDDSRNPSVLLTVRAKGYMLAMESENGDVD